MAKQSEYRFSREKRQQMIKSCEECKGAPETEQFDLQGMCGSFCSKCLNVVDWVKVGPATTIKTKERVLVDRPNGMSEFGTIESIITPGKQIHFSGFQLDSKKQEDDSSKEIDFNENPF